MKVRIKATGEVVEINERRWMIFNKATCESYRFEELESVKEIDWECRRCDIAKDITIAIFNNDRLHRDLCLKALSENKNDVDEIVRIAVDIADVIIKQLKETSFPKHEE